MDNLPRFEPSGCRCRPAPVALEDRLDRLEGFLHHLMSDLMDAMKMLAAAKESAGLDLSETTREELRPPLGHGA